MREQFPLELSTPDTEGAMVADLATLNLLFIAWVETVVRHEATVNARDVVVAMPQGQSWASIPSIGRWRTWEPSGVALVLCGRHGNGQARPGTATPGQGARAT